MTTKQKGVIPFSPGRREVHSTPSDPELASLLIHYAAIRYAYRPLRKGIADLAKDWGSRSVSFWHGQLDALPVLLRAVKPCIALMSGSIIDMPSLLIRIHYDLLFPLQDVKRQIDEVGIHITAYLPVSQSLQVGDLHLRHSTLQEMRELAANVEKALKVIEAVKKGIPARERSE